MLEDVVVIRLILILLLVLYHAFAIFNGAWERPSGVLGIKLYWWIASFSNAFMLETFVFISGYILGYQTLVKGNTMLSYSNLIKKKIKRLLLPSLFFSSIYYVLFYDLDKSIGEILYAILNGCGHLWFLPMLFWCFVAIYVINKLHLRESWVFPIALICSLCSFLPLPFRLNSALYYFFCFYLGFWCMVNHSHISKCFDFKYFIISVCLFFGSFIPLTYIGECTREGSMLLYDDLVSKIIGLFVCKIFRIAYSVSGVVMLFLTINLLLKKKILQLSPLLKKASALCFGVYIYQQFILKYLYYHTGLTLISPSIALPWIAFLIALISSLLFSWLTIKMRFGRFLIG